MLFVIPFSCFVFGLLAGHSMMRTGRACRLAGLVALLGCAGGWVFWREGATSGLDVLLYTLVLWGAVLPSALALVMGAALGWIAQRQTTSFGRM